MSEQQAAPAEDSTAPSAAETACLILDKLGWTHRNGQWASPEALPGVGPSTIEHFQHGFQLGWTFGSEDRKRVLRELLQCEAELETAAELIGVSLPATASIFLQAAERVNDFRRRHGG